MRLDPYIEGVLRPIKLRLKTQTATKIFLSRTYQLRDVKEYKDMFIIKSMNEQETNFSRIEGRRGKAEKLWKNNRGKNKVSFLEKRITRQWNGIKTTMLERREKEKNGTVTKGNDKIKIMYTNIDGIIARKLQLVVYLKEKKPEIVCLTET